MVKLVINREKRTAKYFIEDLGNGVGLEMVLIPGGSFMMGSPEDEIGHRDNESPQHLVTINPFCMGKYPVTQAQWKAVATLPQVKQELNPDPSNFKGDNRPVERISWYDAEEFCARLSQKSTRECRLPSEAEWEYACRAGTATPFHFGETITTDLANYNGNYTYGSGVEGIDRQETTPVGNFDVANAFGLYDMHGNVWEWCADHWHDDYEEGPDNGSIWLSSNERSRRVLRGGSWYFNPGYCRAAVRYHYNPSNNNNNIGFRVVCGAAWIQ
ncbi:hypothetical protein NIES2119_19965 [[Phormidium ambiguum] IAM M-71]|uniref:Sulfatase-modifying factor enzyme-like domain-containing protein n=1 Tax=[Phormidium ambiguum] IAM M-71 TaxID=454136 RepID=A0A1U7IEW6_9CYAN|nr:formylglycine-generating enzyme family protein [Phormidium ambiguum]OKH35535.1 hypothetical protein NIES2119_19965 [Phormidium ambiguum IAM M-71]